MTDLRKAAEMALEALEAHADFGIKADKSIEALRQALAQPEQEPVKCTCGYAIGHPLVSKCICSPPKREWVGLTDEEIEVIAKRLMDDAAYCSLHFAVAIGAKLKEKNGG